jgi:hypothetical protein
VKGVHLSGRQFELATGLLRLKQMRIRQQESPTYVGLSWSAVRRKIDVAADAAYESDTGPKPDLPWRKNDPEVNVESKPAPPNAAFDCLERDFLHASEPSARMPSPRSEMLLGSGTGDSTGATVIFPDFGSE